MAERAHPDDNGFKDKFLDLLVKWHSKRNNPKDWVRLTDFIDQLIESVTNSVSEIKAFIRN